MFELDTKMQILNIFNLKIRSNFV